MKYKLFIVGVFLGLVALLFWYRWETRIVHIHAGFLVYVNGIKEDFSQIKYMKMEKCGTNEPEDEQLEKAHLHDQVGDVVHVHRRGALWGDLFNNINYQFPEGELVGYVNGKRTNNILKYPIKAYDSVVIMVGSTNRVDISEMISTNRIKEIENKSENCGKN